MIEIKKGTMDMLDELTEMYCLCVKNMRENSIFQWDDKYPSRETVLQGLSKGELYCLRDEGKIAGAVILNELEPPEYRDVQWSPVTGRCLVVHTMAVHPDYQRKGYGKALLKYWEMLAENRGYSSIRLDTFPGNAPAVHLYEGNGYNFVGKIYFDFKEEPHCWYHCYEKVLE